jgi:hexosaminidase
MSTRADQLLQLADMGQQALRYLADGQKAPAGWKTKQTTALDEASKPSALVHFVFLPAMTDLVNAVSE